MPVLIKFLINLVPRRSVTMLVLVARKVSLTASQ